jgi:hypothetical protein
MTIIWGSNFTLVKLAVRDIPELPFNRGPRRAFSMSRSLATATQPALVSRSAAGVEQPPALIASAMFLLALAVRKESYTLTRAEWRRILELGFVGHFVYQLCLLGAVARTTVAKQFAARSLPITRSPLLVTGYSMTIGSLLYLPVAWRGLGSLVWTEVRAGAWAALVASALLAVFVTLTR